MDPVEVQIKLLCACRSRTAALGDIHMGYIAYAQGRAKEKKANGKGDSGLPAHDADVGPSAGRCS